MSKSMFKRCAVAFAVALGAAAGAQAALITNGFTFTVADGFTGAFGVGTHYHSNTGGSFGNLAGQAEVGRFGAEETRGLSEYNIAGQAAASSAFVTFDIVKAGGLFAGTNDAPFAGTIIIEAYTGNNREDVSDFQAPLIGQVGTFAISPATHIVGDVFSFDVTSLFNGIVGASGSSLGIRLREDPNGPEYGSSTAWTFHDFRLTSTNDCTGAACGVPEPGSLALVGLALLAAGAARRRS